MPSLSTVYPVITEPLASAGAHTSCTLVAEVVPSIPAGAPGADGRSWMPTRRVAVTVRSGSLVPSVTSTATTMSPTNPGAGVSRTVEPSKVGPDARPAAPSMAVALLTVSPRPIGSTLPVSMSTATGTPPRPSSTLWSGTVASGNRDPVTVTASAALPLLPSPSTTSIGTVTEHAEFRTALPWVARGAGDRAITGSPLPPTVT